MIMRPGLDAFDAVLRKELVSDRDSVGINGLHDAARQAARDERDRLAVPVSDYVCGRIAEAVLAVVEHRPLELAPDAIDVDSEEVA